MLLIAGMLGVAWAATGPKAKVQEVTDKVLAVLKDESLDKSAKREKLRELIAPVFDFEAMSRSILAQDWKKASPEQQKRFIELFQKVLENTYITALETYAGQTVEYGKEDVEGRKATVETFIIQPNGVKTPVVYKLFEKDGQWHGYDFVAEGISLIRNYRSSLRNIAQTKGIDGVIAEMERKAAEPPKPATAAAS
ncbi:MAG: ABC transporter substrate-binding protein [Thiohalocapsa sp.]|jgi:phospholipid transport system substrate-binding protein